MNYHCEFCSKKYKLKRNYDNHIVCCKYFHTPKSERQAELDRFETPPSPHEMFSIIKELAAQCSHLKKEIEILKNNSQKSKRRLVIDWLNKPDNEPPIKYKEWCETFAVTHKHLVTVFEGNLMDGIKQCVYDGIQKMNIQNIPARAFTQKQNILYIYEDGRGWSIWSNESFEKWINEISHRFLQEFMKWQMSEDKPKVDDEKMIIYSKKILFNKQIHVNELRKCVYKNIEHSLQTVDFE